MLNNHQQTNKLETEQVVELTLDLLAHKMKHLEEFVERKEWLNAYNAYVDLAHGLKLLHSALDVLSDCEKFERTSQN